MDDMAISALGFDNPANNNGGCTSCMGRDSPRWCSWPWRNRP
ncbi:MAG: hypothetical protein GWP91_19715 [Rhodobacterales bacterium]|nr:hypothetical protein [Rhodobacterales bacterium]